MLWPARPTCHDRPGGPETWREPRPQGRDEDDPYGYPFRACSYCGSVHPEDLVRLLQEGKTRLGGADWKYGWPHKFYVTLPNPKAGQRVCASYRSAGQRPTTLDLGLPGPKREATDEELLAAGWSVVIDREVETERDARGTRETRSVTRTSFKKREFTPASAMARAKWYNYHLRDEGYDDEAWALLARLLQQHAGIAWEREAQPEGGVKVKYVAPYPGFQKA